MGTNGQIGLYHLPQALHFSGPGNTGFNDGHFMPGLNSQKGNGYPNLRIITSGASVGMKLFPQQLMQPFFHNGFSVAAGNTDYRACESAAVVCRQLLQGRQNIRNPQDIAVWQHRNLKILRNHETANPLICGGMGKFSTLTVRAGQCKKQGLRRVTNSAAIIGRLGQRSIRMAVNGLPFQNCGNFLPGIMHVSVLPAKVHFSTITNVHALNRTGETGIRTNK